MENKPPYTITPSLPVDPIVTQAPEPTMSGRERELINTLRRVGFFRVGHRRRVLVEWDGSRPIVFDCEPII